MLASRELARAPFPPIKAENALAVGLGELKLTRTGELVAYSLGSCVAICLHDPHTGVGAMAHVVLPAAPAAAPQGLPGKYADTAVPALLDALRREGADPLRLRCWLAGGAAVLAIGGAGSLPKIGDRNVEAVKAALTQVRLRVLAQATGGTQGRTVRLDATKGLVLVRTVGGPEVQL
ncbi:MAG: chemotaxis protein CheD [Chloroflexi bacterium]|nr:chemotaxis protein CheD [Chloroflexota bacterium]